MSRGLHPRGPKGPTLSEALDSLVDRVLCQCVGIDGTHGLYLYHPLNDLRVRVEEPESIAEGAVSRKRLRSVLLALCSEAVKEALAR